MILLTVWRTTTQAFSAVQYRHAYPRAGSVSLIQRFLSSDTGERTEAELQVIQAERDARKYVFKANIFQVPYSESQKTHLMLFSFIEPKRNVSKLRSKRKRKRSVWPRKHKIASILLLTFLTVNKTPIRLWGILHESCHKVERSGLLQRLRICLKRILDRLFGCADDCIRYVSKEAPVSWCSDRTVFIPYRRVISKIKRIQMNRRKCSNT